MLNLLIFQVRVLQITFSVSVCASDVLSRLSFLKTLSDTQQIFEEVNVRRGINLLADGTCHHDRTGNATNRRKTQSVRRDTENTPNIAVI